VRVRKIGLIEAGYRDLVRKSRSRASSSRDDCLFLLHVILAMFRPGSCSLKLLQVTSCELNKKMVVRYRFTGLRAELQDLSSFLDDDLRSSLEGGGPRSGGGCLFQRRASRVRDEERVRETGESSRLLVSAANGSTLLFLDRMVLAVNGFMILNDQRRTMF